MELQYFAVPNAPLDLQGSAVDTTTIQVVWSHPDVTYGNLGMYRVTYKGLMKDMEEVGYAKVISRGGGLYMIYTLKTKGLRLYKLYIIRRTS